MTLYVIPDICQLTAEIFFSKIGMSNVSGITKNVPNLQVHKYTPVTLTTLSNNLCRFLSPYVGTPNFGGHKVDLT